MTLLEVIRTIEGMAMRQPTIHSIVRNDVFRLNALPDARYGVFAWLLFEKEEITIIKQSSTSAKVILLSFFVYLLVCFKYASI